jgi:hypothetical protein
MEKCTATRPSSPRLAAGLSAGPEILLAAFAHPDRSFRDSLLARIDAWIAARQPFHTNKEVRGFLAGLVGTPQAPFSLDGIALEVATRVVRILFARCTRWHYKYGLRLISADAFDGGAGFVIRHSPLRAVGGAISCDGSSHFRRRGCQLFAGPLMVEASGLLHRPVQAVCRARDGFVLEVTGDVRWDLMSSYWQPGRAPQPSPLARFGLVGELTDTGIRLRTPSPEGIIQLSALLVRQELLVLPVGADSRVVVGLRDFDGPSTLLPAFCLRVAERTWLQGLPPMALDLTEADAAAMARWGAVPESWLTPGVLAQVCVSNNPGNLI